MNTIIIAGAGISATQYEFAQGYPIMAVSSGYKCVPEMAHFVSMDKPMMFPSWLTDSDKFIKHVPDTALGQYWKRHPNVMAWDYEDGPNPNFTSTLDSDLRSGSMMKDDCDQTRHNSLLLAVQIAALIGYNRQIFIGVDLLDDGLAPLSEQLRLWYPFAKDAGIDWVNASPISRLCEWMPIAEPAEMMQIMEVAR